MPGPFPGMDPYLAEPARWPDLHHSLTTYIRDALQPQVSPRYFARIGERVCILNPPQALYPDVILFGRSVREAGMPEAQRIADVEAAVDAPVLLNLPPAEHREPYVEILHAGGGQVVAALEVLSPANKAPGDGHRLYRRKLQELLTGPVHLVEIDLLSSGLPTVGISEEGLASLPPHRYLVSVRRGPDRYRFEAYPVPLQRRLPRVRVPLLEGDPDIALDLPVLFARCYDNGRCGELIDYRRQAPVQLSPEECAWADGLLRGRGLRN
jgi:hypothetical protein